MPSRHIHWYAALAAWGVVAVHAFLFRGINGVLNIPLHLVDVKEFIEFVIYLAAGGSLNTFIEAIGSTPETISITSGFFILTAWALSLSWLVGSARTSGGRREEATAVVNVLPIPWLNAVSLYLGRRWELAAE